MRLREQLILGATASASYGGKLVADYDLRTTDIPDVATVPRPELQAIWQTNRTVLKASYFRGRLFYPDRDWLSDEWITVFASGDRNRLVFIRDSGATHFSGNRGAVWKCIRQPANYEFTLAETASGSVLVALASLAELPTANIAAEDLTSKNWYAVVSAASGNQLVLMGGTGESPPVLNIASSEREIIVSWPIGSTNYLLQQSLGLAPANWIDVTNTLKVSNSQCEAIFPVSAGNSFFRLRRR